LASAVNMSLFVDGRSSVYPLRHSGAREARAMVRMRT
jgi:hypothetical protein